MKKLLLTIWNDVLRSLLVAVIATGLFAGSAWALACNDQADGDWNNAGTWDCAVIPDADDDVTVDSHAVTLTGDQDAESVTVAGGTLSIGANDLGIDSNLTVTSGTLDAGTGSVTFQTAGAKALNTGSAVFNDVNIDGGGDVTLTGNMDINGTLSIVSAANMNSGNYLVAGNVRNSDTAINGTSVILLDGTGDQNLEAVTGATRNFTSISINKSAGTLTLLGNMSIDRNWTYTAGTVAAGSSTVQFNNTTGHTVTLASGSMQFNNVTLVTGAQNLTLSGTMDINGQLTITSMGAMNGGVLAVAGNVVNSDTAVTGTSVILLDGSGNQNLEAVTGATRDFTSIRINKSGGTLTLLGAMNIDRDWDYIAGTVAGGTSSVTFGPVAASTITIAPSGSMAFNNLTLNKSTAALTTSGTLDINGNFTLTTLNTWSGSGTLAVAGDVSLVDTAYTQLEDVYLLLDGAGAQQLQGLPEAVKSRMWSSISPVEL